MVLLGNVDRAVADLLLLSTVTGYTAVAVGRVAIGGMGFSEIAPCPCAISLLLLLLVRRLLGRSRAFVPKRYRGTEGAPRT